MNSKSIFIFLFVFSNFGFAADIKEIRILDHGKQTAEIVSPADPLLPQRVYLKYFPKVKRWLFTKTSNSSSFAKPAETLQEGSVLPGLQIGASDILKHYKLLHSGKWQETNEDLHDFVRVDEKTPFVKMVVVAKNFHPPIAPPPPASAAPKR